MRKVEIARVALDPPVSLQDLRDPAADRRRGRRNLALVVVVAGLALSAATFVAIDRRPLDHHYNFYATYGNTNGVPFTLLLPLPADGELRGTWRFLGNGTAATEDSAYGAVLHITASSNISVSARLDTWRDLPQTFTTQGLSAGGHDAVRTFFNSSEPALDSKVRVTFTKADPAWTITRTLGTDLFEGWNTFEIAESQVPTTAT